MPGGVDSQNVVPVEDLTTAELPLSREATYGRVPRGNQSRKLVRWRGLRAQAGEIGTGKLGPELYGTLLRNKRLVGGRMGGWAAEKLARSRIGR